ncbi:DUF2993 domain-containing protein [Chroococcidiopsis sp. CCMEE 29]|uniref:LmeA family phospholipid-binding protein n=1 Tax=Chroococcidiopsis sp. CCMEE 29 TaxID=155894 RepID=UPI002020370B|nr:DUF2993 domain-containing protein [Chroococcidiopsis sp. CCMEE 29]
MNNHNLEKAAIPIERSAQTVSSKQSRIISKVLSPAIRLWLRSQVERVSHLEVKISGGDRQILSGSIPGVLISASNAVYQGLHLTQIQLVGEGIRTNLGQVLKGQPLRLLEVVPVVGELLLQESDLTASLQSPLLANALTELLEMLLPENCRIEGQVSWHKIVIDTDQLILSGTLVGSSSTKPLLLRSGLQLASCHELQLTQPQLQTSQDLLLKELENFKLDLGPEVNIQELTLTPGQMLCRGSINVIPSD